MVAFDQCGLCKEYFSSDASPDNPLTPIQGRCGHSFCRLCVIRRRSLLTGADSGDDTSTSSTVLCPQCQRPSFQLNDLRVNQGLCDSIVAMRELMNSFTATASSALKQDAPSDISKATTAAAAAAAAATTVRGGGLSTATSVTDLVSNTQQPPNVEATTSTTAAMINTSLATTASTLTNTPESSTSATPSGTPSRNKNTKPHSRPRSSSTGHLTTTGVALHNNSHQVARVSPTSDLHHRRTSSNNNDVDDQHNVSIFRSTPTLPQQHQGSHQDSISFDEILPASTHSPPSQQQQQLSQSFVFGGSGGGSSSSMSRRRTSSKDTAVNLNQQKPSSTYSLIVRAVWILYGLVGLIIVFLTKNILVQPPNVQQVWEAVETTELLLQKAQHHQMVLETLIEDTQRLMEQQKSLIRIQRDQKNKWEQQKQKEIQTYYDNDIITMQPLIENHHLQGQSMLKQPHAQQMTLSWKPLLESITRGIEDATYGLVQYMTSSRRALALKIGQRMINTTPSPSSSSSSSSPVPSHSQGELKQRMNFVAQTLNEWLSVFRDHLSVSSIHSLSNEPTARNKSAVMSFFQNLRLPKFYRFMNATTMLTPSFSIFRSRENKQATNPLSYKSTATGSTTQQQTILTRHDVPFEKGDHVVQPKGRWAQRHGIVVNVHERFSSSYVGSGDTKKYIVTIASPSKYWTGGKCTRKTGLWNKHEILASSPKQHRTTHLYLRDDDGDNDIDSLTNAAEVVQRANFLVHLSSNSTESSKTKIFWDLQLLLKQSAWSTAWCKTGSFHGRLLDDNNNHNNKKKQQRRKRTLMWLGGATALTINVVPHTAALAVVAGPLVLIVSLSKSAIFLLQQSSGNYLNIQYERWHQQKARL